MSWLMAVGLALATLLAMVLIFRLPRAAAAAIGAALVLGLAGFSLQSEPDKPGAPSQVKKGGTEESGAALIEARRLFFEDHVLPRNYMIFADAYTRRGQYEDAATILRGAVREHSRDGEAWVALGNALVAHGQGSLSPPAITAYRKAAEAEPESLAPGFFLGAAELQAGRLVEGHKLWAGALKNSPADAPGRVAMEQRLGQLDALIRQIAGQ